ncbi:MAG: PEPxxWA-CTERM sorting domain-containing protein [Thiobacillus sp.]|nr:PEPxxWA-CTERM sorting domain-containing protein [Thiobacillus sp.]
MSTHQPLYAPASQETTAMPSQPHSRKGSAQWLVSSLVAGILGLAATPALAITTYDITLIGLYGAGYTNSSDGYQSNVTQFLSAAGQVAGYAERYNGATYNGQSTWLYSGSTTQEIGLTGTGHTNSSTGYQYNYAMGINAAGNVVGHAYRYNGATAAGYSAWRYNGSTTQEIGLTGGVHTSSDGIQKNVAQTINAAGQVVGQTDRYNGATFNGKSAWLYNGTTTQEIGLTGTGHTRSSDGFQANSINVLNDAGQVAGYAQRYNGATATGYSAWLYNGSTTQEIGLTGTGYAHSSTGYQYNIAQRLNVVGQVTGYAQRYNGTTPTGTSAWLYNGGTTQAIGLTDTGHTRSSDGYQSNFTTGLNAAGQVAGYASRYNGVTDTGRSAWLYNGSTTQEIGLTGTGHTRSDGYQDNYAKFLNATGQVAGVASRHNGATDTGSSAWLFNGSATQEIGLTGTGHTNSSTGYQSNETYFLNAAGQVAGVAQRFNGAITAGFSAWFYDSLSNQTYSMDGSVSSLTGEAYSSIRYLGDDGLALGHFTLYDAAGASLGDRAFSFTVADGWSDLGSLVDGGLNDTGWNYLAATVRANDTGYIVGNGVLTGMNGQAAYLLTPVPEPKTWAMLLAGLGFVVAAARRRKVCAAG